MTSRMWMCLHLAVPAVKGALPKRYEQVGMVTGFVALVFSCWLYVNALT